MKTVPFPTLLALAGLFATPLARAGDVQAFTGAWCNKDFNTRSITRIEIYPDKGDLKVHMWGRCHPTECDWGEATATMVVGDDASITVQWNQGFAIRTQKLKLLEDGTLRLIGTTTYNDNRKPMRDECIFVNGLQHNWSEAPPKAGK